MEASSNNSASGSGSNDNDERQYKKDTSRWQMIDDEMEALCDVDFPIFDKSAKAGHHEGKDNVTTANNNKPEGNKVVDEDAIIRCFDLSIKSHIGGTPVPVFEPMPPYR